MVLSKDMIIPLTNYRGHVEAITGGGRRGAGSTSGESEEAIVPGKGISEGIVRTTDVKVTTESWKKDSEESLRGLEFDGR